MADHRKPVATGRTGRGNPQQSPARASFRGPAKAAKEIGNEARGTGAGTGIGFAHAKRIEPLDAAAPVDRA